MKVTFESNPATPLPSTYSSSSKFSSLSSENSISRSSSRKKKSSSSSSSSTMDTMEFDNWLEFPGHPGSLSSEQENETLKKQLEHVKNHYKQEFKKLLINPDDIDVTFDKFPYFLR